MFGKKKEKPLMIIQRDGHCELHYDKKVDFVTLEGKKLGSSKVHKYVKRN